MPLNEAYAAGNAVDLDRFTDLNKTLNKYKRIIRTAVKRANREDKKENKE